MKNAFHLLAAGFVTASLPVTAQAAPGNGDLDRARTEPPFFGEPGYGHLLGSWSRGHEFAFGHHDVGRFGTRGFGRDDHLFHRHRFVTDFRFFQFAYPYDWDPDYDYGKASKC